MLRREFAYSRDTLSPYFVAAITIGVRILGPALGFILGSLCTMIYADLSANPQITPTDPRWVGAWWLGKLIFLVLITSYTSIRTLLNSFLPSFLFSVKIFFFPLLLLHLLLEISQTRLEEKRWNVSGLVLIAAMLMLVSIGMFAFPTRLPASRTPPKRADAKKPSLRGKRSIYRGDANCSFKRPTTTASDHSDLIRFYGFPSRSSLPYPLENWPGRDRTDEIKVSSPRNRLLIATPSSASVHIRLDSIPDPTFRICFNVSSR